MHSGLQQKTLQPRSGMRFSDIFVADHQKLVGHKTVAAVQPFALFIFSVHFVESNFCGVLSFPGAAKHCSRATGLQTCYSN